MSSNARTSSFFDRLRLALGLALALGAAGCPGTIPAEERERFVGGGSSCGIGPGNVPSAILAPRCGTSGCHDATSRSGGLDLVSANLASRLVNVPSSSCPGHTLVIPGDTTNSFLYVKLNPNPACGTQMPNGMAPLAETDLACIRAWLRTLGSSPTDGGMDVVVGPDAQDVPVPIDMPMPMDNPMPMDTPPTDNPMPMDVPMDVPMPMDAGTDATVDTPMPTDDGLADTGVSADTTPDDTGTDDAATE